MRREIISGPLQAKLWIGDRDENPYRIEYDVGGGGPSDRLPDGGSTITGVRHALYRGRSPKKTQEHIFNGAHLRKGPAHIHYDHIVYGRDGSTAPGLNSGIEFGLPEGSRFDLGSGRWLIHGDSFQETQKFYPPFRRPQT